MAAAAEVSFDVLLGGKVTPEVLKSFKTLEDLMKKQGATARTVNAVMSRAYRETFDKLDQDAKKSFEHVEHNSKEMWRKMTEQAREAQKKVSESFEKMRESFKKFAETVNKPLEYLGITGLVTGAIATFAGAHAGEELIKEGIKVRRARETETATLRATLAGRGAGEQTGEYEEAAERVAQRARVGHDEAMKLITRLSSKFKTPDEAERMAMSLIGLGGGTTEGAEAARAAYAKANMMMLTGRVRGTAIGAIGGGGGLGGALLQQLARDTGIPVTELTKQLSAAKISKKGEVSGGALSGAKGIEALNKAIIELGESKGFDLIKAKMTGMDGMFYRFSEHWEDFTAKIGEAFEKFIMPIADRVNELLDSINFNQVFDAIVTRAQEFGHLISAVWDTIANAPVIHRIQAMWENFWKAFTGGVELYGPYVETWNDNLHHELGVHMARHMTEAGRKWVEETSKTVEGIIKNILDAFDWFIKNGPTVWFWVKTIGEAFLLLTAINIATPIFNFIGALGKLAATLIDITSKIFGMVGKATGTATAAGAEGAAAGGAGRLAWLATTSGTVATTIAGLGFVYGVSRMADVIGNAIQKKFFPTVGAGQTAEGERLRAMMTSRETWIKGGGDPSRYNTAIEQFWTHMTDAQKKSTGYTEQQIKALTHSKETIEQWDAALKKSTGNDLMHFDAAIAATTAALQQLTTSMAGFGAGGAFGGSMGGGFTGAVTGAHFTEYGPAVAGDQPGQATYDWNSYHHVGAWPGVTGPLRAGDVALGYGAQAKYHVQPGQMFTDEYGRTWRFADRSGSKDPFNVDVFKGAMGGIFNRPTRALIGESGPEAVVPLSGAGAAAAGLGGLTVNVNVAGHADDPEAIARAVQRVVQEHWRRSAVV